MNNKYQEIVESIIHYLNHGAIIRAIYPGSVFISQETGSICGLRIDDADITKEPTKEP